MAQTAVEYIIDKMQNAQWEYTSWTERGEIIEQAKLLHKQEIIDAYMDRMDITDKEAVAKIIGEQYYQETFKK